MKIEILVGIGAAATSRLRMFRDKDVFWPWVDLMKVRATVTGQPQPPRYE